jgi:hypothetical protein
MNVKKARPIESLPCPAQPHPMSGQRAMNVPQPGLDLTPGKYYFQKDAEFAIRIAESIITLTRTILAATG